MKKKNNDVVYCESLAKGFFAKHFDFNTYSHSITSSIVIFDLNNWKNCLNTIPVELLVDYKKYLQDVVEQADYKPDPWVFLFGGESPAEIEKKSWSFGPSTFFWSIW